MDVREALLQLSHDSAVLLGTLTTTEAFRLTAPTLAAWIHLAMLANIQGADVPPLPLATWSAGQLLDSLAGTYTLLQASTLGTLEQFSMTLLGKLIVQLQANQLCPPSLN